MSVFAGAAEAYRQFRPGIPAAVADVLDAAAPRTRPRRLLDVGTGTGLVVVALADRFDDIVAVDPDVEMVAVAEENLREVAGTTRLTLLNARAEDFEPPTGWEAELVTICRTFHWLDQAAVLTRLDSYVAPDGAVAIFGDRSFWSGTSEWLTAVRAAVQRLTGQERRAGKKVFATHDRPYSDILAESPFADVVELTVPVRRTWTVPAVVGYLRSTSFAGPAAIPDGAALERAVRDALAPFDGVLDEDNEFVIRIGRRPR